ncbi:hypothetical protein PROFUN_00550 [Planoprotostelium fungivorum]|uniref:Uncharacterized protein n=1 Tax=Planoprotostelium fungivorum TaxID=1890364 RepID=A0A2P6N169_9EUKA|nr:hypothetical protein PROFUN_00550 [Planoprotostelium fungivorum]
MISTWLIIFSAVAAYLLACRYFRFKRLRDLQRDWIDRDGSFKIRSVEDARIILEVSNLYESTFMWETSIELALFRTYGIPTISKVLVSTGQLSQPESAGKRAEDTGLLLQEALYNPWDTERSRTAISRINYLHSRYGKRITNDDMLYTLSLFILEPMRWLEMYEWRPLSDVEKYAQLTLWTALGQRMGITGIPNNLKDLEKFSVDYEENPKIRAGNGDPAIVCTFGRQTAELHAFSHAFSMDGMVRTVCLKVSSQISPVFLLTQTEQSPPYFSEKNPTGRYHKLKSNFQPFYARSSVYNRLYFGLLGFDLKEEKWMTEGYKIEELGPNKLKDAGHEQVSRGAQIMFKCPFVLPSRGLSPR